MAMHTPSKEGGREGRREGVDKQGGRRGNRRRGREVKWKRTDRQLPKMQKMPMAIHTPSKVSLLTVVEDQKRRPAQAIRQTAQTLSNVPGKGGWKEFERCFYHMF